MIAERSCECVLCVGCDRQAFTIKKQEGKMRAVCRRCNGGWCEKLSKPQEVPSMGGQGSGRPKSTSTTPRGKHTLTVSDYIWERLVDQAGGERKVSELLDSLLTSYVAILDAKKK